MLGIMLSYSAYADGEWNHQFGDWVCYGKSGVIEESYKIESYTDNVSADVDHSYNLLCTFAHKVTINNEAYLLRILFPNCQFTSDNQLITIKLVKYIDNNGEAVIDDAKYQVNFLPNTTYFTGAEINQDQNVKAAFFTEIIGQNSLNLTIQDVGNVNVELGGLQQGTQTTYCNQ
jgi:hypothetical protein